MILVSTNLWHEINMALSRVERECSVEVKHTMDDTVMDDDVSDERSDGLWG